MKATPTEMKNNLQGINNRIDEAEYPNSNLEKGCKKHPVRIAKR